MSVVPAAAFMAIALAWAVRALVVAANASTPAVPEELWGGAESMSHFPGEDPPPSTCRDCFRADGRHDPVHGKPLCDACWSHAARRPEGMTPTELRRRFPATYARLNWKRSTR